MILNVTPEEYQKILTALLENFSVNGQLNFTEFERQLCCIVNYKLPSAKYEIKVIEDVQYIPQQGIRRIEE